MFVHVRTDHFSEHLTRNSRKLATGCCCKQDKSVADVEHRHSMCRPFKHQSSQNAIFAAQNFALDHFQLATAHVLTLQAHKVVSVQRVHPLTCN